MSHTPTVRRPVRPVRRAVAGLAGLVSFLAVLVGPGTAFAYTDRGSDPVANDPAPIVTLTQPAAGTQLAAWITGTVAVVIIAALATALVITSRRLTQQRRSLSARPANA